jgi:hypothetical protein
MKDIYKQQLRSDPSNDLIVYGAYVVCYFSFCRTVVCVCGWGKAGIIFTLEDNAQLYI